MNSPSLQVLFERGLKHEAEYVKHLKDSGRSVVELPSGNELTEADGIARTLDAMRSGSDVITQARLQNGRWFGIADVLRRVQRPCAVLGAWSYEPYDTKLSRETKAGAVLQLCLYADLLEVVQGVRPEFLHVVPPGNNFAPDTHRVDDFIAYYRQVKRQLESAVDQPRTQQDPITSYPEPSEQCEVCRWRVPCDEQRRGDDHLSLVANCGRSQRNELVENGVRTLESLAKTSVPIAWKPKRGTRKTLEKAREQARIQLEGRTRKSVLHELLPVESGRGLS